MTKHGLWTVKLEYNRDNTYRSDIIQQTEVNWVKTKQMPFAHSDL